MAAPVLVISPDPELNTRLRELLPGPEARFAASLSEAARQLNRSEGLILVDARLPDTARFVRRLRESSSYEDVPLVAVVGDETLGAVGDLLDAGVNDCLTRPIHPALLRAKIRHLARERGWRFGPYRLLQPLGSGAFGSVWRAVHDQRAEPIALKLLSDAWLADQEAVARFEREVGLLAKLRLPFLVRFYEAGQVNDRSYLAMELLEGDTAQSLLAKRGPFSLAQGLRIARNVSCALAGLAAHELLHRDIKPGNVVVDATGDATLIDLGLARPETGGKLTATSAIVGTPEYLAPEVVRGEPEQFSSDIYSLGATLWTCWSGRLPYVAKSPYALLIAVAKGGGVPPLEQLRADLPAEVSQLVGAMLAATPGERPHVNDVAATFTRLLEEHAGS